MHGTTTTTTTTIIIIIINYNVILKSHILETMQNSVSIGTDPCSCTLHIVIYVIYLFNAIGLPPGGSGPYTVHKRQEQYVVYIRRNNTEHTTHRRHVVSDYLNFTALPYLLVPRSKSHIPACH